MAKKISKWFRIGVEGDTCDGRVIDANDIQQMAETFDPRVYGCRINLEHIRGLLPTGDFKRLGDVVELKAEKIDDDSALNGKWALYGKIAPTDTLVEWVRDGQKVYTSMEIRPNFANSGKAYLVGLAVTDDPASLGTEYLEFCANATANPLANRKEEPGDLFSVASLAELEFIEQGHVLESLSAKVRGLFSRKAQHDDDRFADVHDAVTTIAEQVQSNSDSTEQRFQELEAVTENLRGELAEERQQVTALRAAMDNTENPTQSRRQPATGGNGEDTLLTNC